MSARSIIFISAVCLLTACREKKPASRKAPREKESAPAPPAPLDENRLRQKAARLKAFAADGRYNTRYACFVDFSVFSGRRRFVLYDLEKDSILSRSLVTHGQGPDFRTEAVAFSNEPGSRCSSPGIYRIGAKYTGRFGTAYKLHGLEASNNKAFERFVVLHAHACVPAVEVNEGICRSDGCPTLNPAYFARLQPYIDRAARPVLLWIYR
ncbi:murein L,D-transpeptidase catalytic domain-containing protein [Chitinophaga alhagiae]|uniref:murein L,D-transpeptidase catalytic domain-containing protein n=1 Tax=Chitinophaga alhagiae TaxID=2203219 RepID=UPI000E5A847C|nr:murein L,D-transpeptidase catalytic domain family protein [Chitinophaga alhagiae]